MHCLGGGLHSLHALLVMLKQFFFFVNRICPWSDFATDTVFRFQSFAVSFISPQCGIWKSYLLTLPKDETWICILAFTLYLPICIYFANCHACGVWCFNMLCLNPHIIQIHVCSGITHGGMLNGELYAQQRLIDLHLFTECFMKISPQSCRNKHSSVFVLTDDWREIFMKHSVNKCRCINFWNLCVCLNSLIWVIIIFF